MITTPYMGQFGNCLFQYVIGKILADRTGQAYEPGPWLNKAGGVLKWNLRPLLIPKPTPGERNGLGPLHIDCLFWFDIDNVLPGWNIEARGFFQRYELIKPYKEKIRNDWLKIDPALGITEAQHSYCFPSIPYSKWTKYYQDAVYIHVRRTDYLGDHLSPERNCQSTTLDEYAKCLARFPDAKKIVLVSDDYNDPFLKEFHRFGLPIELAKMHDDSDMPQLNGTWDGDFLRMLFCRWLIMSQSTYSWWAGFLGLAEKIVCPCFPNSLWGKGVGLIGPPKGTDYPNLFVDDEPGRWEWVTE